MANNRNEEPSTAPQPNKWYDITLGPSFKDNRHYSPKFCTLRYEFKPASIDNHQPGYMHKSKDNRVNVEFQNNQPGKPKVSFEGVSEDYKDNDAVLFFDGEVLRLERLHRAVKRLRHVRLPGESTASAAPVAAASVSPATESHSPLGSREAKLQPSSTDIVRPVRREHIDFDKPECLEPENEKHEQHPSSLANPSAASQDLKDYESEEHIEIDDDLDYNYSGATKRENASNREFQTGGIDININIPHPVDVDDEIADVDVSGDEANTGPNAAEALRAQVNAEGRGENASSSSSSSGSESSESGSGSGSGSGSKSDSGNSSSSSSETSSTDSKSSDGDSVSSV